MKILHNASLKQYNSFGIDARAKTFISVNDLDELKKVLKQNYSEDIFILGGGSNMLLTKDIETTVVQIGLKGKEIVKQTEEEILIKVQAGENWHQTVLWTIENNWGGLENLSLIPGNTGTAPIQNIGAYGVELKDSFFSCEAINLQTLEIREFDNAACEFGYRNSIFKNFYKGKYIITSVTFRLTRKNHILHTEYGAIQEALDQRGIKSVQLKDISEAVISIRNKKLPDPKKLGNSGSFFKNPIIQGNDLQILQIKYPEIPTYKISETEYKVPAGWLIEKAGLKGYREGDAGVHINQALVLVNYGTATGEEILNLSKKIQSEVYEKFQIFLHPEVNIF